MNSLNEFSEITERIISNISLPKEPVGLYEPIRYALSSGGKRIRPILTLSTAEATGIEYQKAISQAIGIELFHNFTLLHDDVMDKSELRRGKPTVHKKWNETTAILSGDAMFSLCIYYLTSDFRSEKSMEILSLFHKTAIDVYEGQQYDLDFEKRIDVTVDEYLNMIKLKTSVLLGCASAIGAILSDSSANTIESFYNYGIKLGLAFQLKDDYLDTFGDTNLFGKKTGNDIVTNKKTWLLIKALEKDKSGVTIQEIMNPSEPQKKYDIIKNIYEKLDIDKECMTLIEKYSLDAIDCLKNVDISPEAYSFFKDLALSSIHRIK